MKLNLKPRMTEVIANNLVTADMIAKLIREIDKATGY